METGACDPAGVDPAADLPRRWWFPGLRGLRPAEPGTYGSFELDCQPPVPDLDDLGWLEAVSEAIEYPIDSPDVDPRSPLNTHELDTLGVPVRLPTSLTTLAARRDFRGRIRSASGCYLDLGDHAVLTADGGYLIHVMTDLQWNRHWLLFIDADGHEAVVTTTRPIGFDAPGAPGPEPLPLHDGDLELCADSFAEFLFRFWIENELWWAVQDGGELPAHLVTYASLLLEAAAAPF